ncbi:MAG TPA: hypothetical protein VN437_04100, partial [Rectinemataceae bacterium]|nr:hypothetical protein [Rectinemataceae bacterium]
CRAALSTILLFVFVFAGLVPCFGQDAAEATAEPTVSSPIPQTFFPPAVPKEKRKTGAVLGRIAIIGLGSLPFTLFYTNFIFDTARFVGNGFDTQYAPWPFKTQYSAAVTSEETFLRLGISLGVSAVIGILDVVIPRKQ